MTCGHGQSQTMKKEEADVAAVSGLMGSPTTGAGGAGRAALQNDAEIGSVGACLLAEPRSSKKDVCVGVLRCVSV